MRKNRSFAVSLSAFVVVVLVGAAFIRLEVGKRAVEQRAKAAQISLDRTRAMEQRIDGISRAVYSVAAELHRSGDAGDFDKLAAKEVRPDKSTGQLWLVSGNRIIDSYPTMREDSRKNHLPINEWGEDPKDQRGSNVQKVISVDIDQITSDEWAIVIRVPLLLNDQGKGRNPVGWVAGSLPLEELYRESGIARLPATGWDYQFSASSPVSGRTQVLAASAEVDFNDGVKQELNPGGSAWILRVRPRNGWSILPGALIHSVFVFIFALAAAIVTYDQAKKTEKHREEVAKNGQRLKNAHQRLVDETQQRGELEKQLSHATFHDAFTGMPNRRYLMERLERALQRVRHRSDYLLAVIVLDFDRLKNIQESLGPSVGDGLLLQAMHRFEMILRPSDLVVARLAGDELAFLLFDIRAPGAAIGAAERMQRALAEPFSIENQTVFTTASMGIALSSSGYDRPEEIVRRANVALLKAKSEGRARAELFDPATQDQMVSLQQLENDLPQAIERNELRLNFQPIISLETGTISGMEVLLRWHHRLEGAIPTDKLIRIAEETGLIVSISRWVFREACLQARTWLANFPQDVPFYLTVNLSAQDMKQPDLCDFVASVLRENSLPRGIVRIEVTESIMIGNVGAASGLVARLREIGVPLLLDDFGTGYSSLSYLNRFKFDYLKIDRAFVSRITPDGQNMGIVRAIVHLAKDLEIKTVAEGVETSEGTNQLRALGCDYAQGFYFSKPLDAKAAESLLRSRPQW